jgi:hypothetical protein
MKKYETVWFLRLLHYKPVMNFDHPNHVNPLELKSLVLCLLFSQVGQCAFRTCMSVGNKLFASSLHFRWPEARSQFHC